MHSALKGPQTSEEQTGGGTLHFRVHVVRVLNSNSPLHVFEGWLLPSTVHEPTRFFENMACTFTVHCSLTGRDGVCAANKVLQPWLPALKLQMAFSVY